MQPSLTTIQGECSTMAGASLMPKGIPSFLICACQINGGPYTVNVIPHECLWESGGGDHACASPNGPCTLGLTEVRTSTRRVDGEFRLSKASAGVTLSTLR